MAIQHLAIGVLIIEEIGRVVGVFVNLAPPGICANISCDGVI
jgi:hypothetical protein